MSTSLSPPSGWEVVPSKVDGIHVWRPVPDDPRNREAPEGGYRCGQCGAAVSYDVAECGIACGHCGFVAAARAEMVGREARADAFTTGAFKLANATWQLERKELHCDGCGADMAVEDGHMAASCPFCGSSQVLLRPGSDAGLRPSAVVPFKVDADGLKQRVREWLGRGWMHPQELAEKAVLDRFVGMYLPFWTFDATAHAGWEAEVGYTKTRRVYRNGEWKSETYTEWRWEQGHVVVPLHDRIQAGTTKVHAGMLGRAGRYDLGDLHDYSPDFLAGWQAQAYDIGLQEAWDTARGRMREDVQRACRGDAGSSKVRNLSVSADFEDERWRYVLLPAHLCAYRWRDTTYRIVVNGQTGALVGQRPVVWSRVWTVVALTFAPGVLTGLVGLPLLLLGIGVVVLGLAVVLLLAALGVSLWIVSAANKAEEGA